ncbi:conserved hypothetical protein [Acidovorax delafieldii 2AN]|uniref:Uncharacterized protein n=1 Tax=Acidovorax delafieldii 2AN TaxID=573060 RepID=C5T703_ACIDE|nr:hypothetical protein [Acidovorax delafieldii]EER59741.1 conserved hypothetical protein [Acidovorax delafieldii 2AN]
MLKKIVATALLISAGLAHAFAPQAGTWVVSSELDGKPGRGLAIDVQNDTFVMQMYAYESSGQPTFYLASGKIANNQVSAALIRYSGGRYLGSGALSGKEAGNAGTANFRFTSGTTGFVTLPGEPEKAISRFNFGYPFAAPSLVGVWSLTSIGTDGLLSDAVQLATNLGPTSTGNGLVASPDGLFGCEHQISGNLAGSVLCVKINSQGQLQRSYLFTYSVNDGEGYSMRSSSGTQQMLSVRRLANPQGTGTGLVYKAGEPVAAEHPALRAHLSDVAAHGFAD